MTVMPKLKSMLDAPWLRFLSIAFISLMDVKAGPDPTAIRTNISSRRSVRARTRQPQPTTITTGSLEGDDDAAAALALALALALASAFARASLAEAGGRE